MIPVPPRLADLNYQHFQSPGDWREYQAETISRIINSPKRFVLVQAPTGAGKSPIAVAASDLIEPKVLRHMWEGSKNDATGRLVELVPQSSILTTTKQLQAQYLWDFQDRAIELKGKSNYDCIIEPVTADQAPCNVTGSKACPARSSCPYYQTRDLAVTKPLGIHNYANYLTNVNYTGTFADQTMLILDEAHLLDDQLMGFISRGINLYTCRKLDILPPTSNIQRGLSLPFHEWQGWAKTWEAELTGQVERMYQALKTRLEPDLELRRTWNQAKTLLGTMKYLIQAKEPWICTPLEDYGWEFKPVWIGQYAEDLLYRYASKVVLMSATILDPIVLAKLVGINPDDLEFIDVPSTFPIGSRPIYYNPQMVVKGGMKDAELKPLLDSIYRTCREHEGEKGLIHTVSFPLAQAIVRQAPDDVKYRLMGHNSKDRLRVYEEFRASNEDRILISPSMKEGISLEDNQCRFIVVAKVPFPYLGDPQTKARMDSPMGRDWYAWRSFCDLIQMTGRGMRSVEDYCAVYILDQAFGRLFNSMRRFVPKYWKNDLVDVKGAL